MPAGIVDHIVYHRELSALPLPKTVFESFFAVKEEGKATELWFRLDNRPRRNHYQAPKLTVLDLDQAKPQLVARAMAGDRDAEELLKLIATA